MPLSRSLKIACFSLATTLSSTSLANETSSQQILLSYANIASDAYTATLADATSLQSAINRFANAPSAQHFSQAKAAWLTSRESYGLTEIFRLSGGPIDAEDGWVATAYGAPEGQLNAWPLDENMIDYTINDEGKRTSGNIIDTAGQFNPGGEDATAIDVSKITVTALASLNENGGDANVASGYHAIEFLLWGQDQDYANFTADTVTPGPLTAGQRPLTDFTSDTFASRRLEYLQAASTLLVSDIQTIASAWQKQASNDCTQDPTGCYRAALLSQLKGKDADKNIPAADALKNIIMGMGVFIKSELANERIAVAVLTPSEEDEHSCFSDNTHRDITLNYQGFVNILHAKYQGKHYGKSLFSISDKATQNTLSSLITSIDAKVSNMNQLAKTTWHFDHQILAKNNAKEIKAMKNEMRKLGDVMVMVAKAVDLSLTKGDVTDADETKF